MSSHSQDARQPQVELPLPFELVDDILCNLREGGHMGTLRACARANRALAFVARMHIFHSVHIGNLASWRSLSTLITGNPAIAAYVRVLSFTDRGAQLAKRSALEPGQIPFHVLSSVTQLNIGRMWLTDFLFGQLSPLFRHVQSLQLYDVRFHRESFFIDCTSHAALRSLFISEGLLWVIRDVSPTSLLTPKTPLEMLTVDAFSLTTPLMARSLRISPRHLQLRLLDVIDEDWSTEFALNLQAISERTESLTASIRAPITDIWTTAAVRLQWKELRHLTLCSSHDTQICISEAGGFLYQMLLCCISSPIESIRLRLTYDDGTPSFARRQSDTAPPKLAFGAEIFELLDESCFESLISFAIDLTCEYPLRIGARVYGDTLERIEANVRALFGPLDARGILELRVSFQSL